MSRYINKTTFLCQIRNTNVRLALLYDGSASDSRNTHSNLTLVKFQSNDIPEQWKKVGLSVNNWIKMKKVLYHKKQPGSGG